jgi:F-type H+-transporting ATPase subunit delta
MAEMMTIARPYADAAFKTAIEQATLPSWSDALQRLSAVIASPLASQIIGNPNLSADAIATVVADVAGQMSPEQRNFVTLLAQNDRLTALPDIAAQFGRQRHQHESVVDAHVVSAFALSDAQAADIRSTLETKYSRAVELTVSVDPELIGGVSIRVGDEVMDASVRGKLAQLAVALKN